jgi:CHAT domain-containing protein/Flp pilus assembly protein TadD
MPAKTIKAESGRKSWCVVNIIASVLTALIVGTCATPSIMVTEAQREGDYHFNRHDYREAALHYREMLEASSRLGIYRNLSMESEVRRKLADCCIMTGDYPEALRQVKEAMVLDSLDNNLLNMIEDHRHEGKIHIYTGAYLEGITSLEKALYLSEGMEQSLKDANRLAIADTYLALGQLFAVMGRLRESQDYSSHAMTIFRQTGDRRGEMECCLTLGSVFSDLGDIISSRNLVERSLALAGDLGLGTARHFQLLAVLSAAEGSYEDAIRNQEKAIQDAYRVGILGQKIWTTIGMGDIYSELGDVARAERYYLEAREMKDTARMTAGSLEASLDMRMGELLDASSYFTAERSLTGGAITSLRLAGMMILEGNADSALMFTGQAESSFLESGNRQGLANTKLLRGKILVDQGNGPEALRALDSALLAGGFPETVWQAHYHKGRMYEMTNRDDDALESYRKSVETIEGIRSNLTVDEFKSIFFDSKKDVYDRLIRLLLRRGDEEGAFQLSELSRARTFYEMISNRKISYGGSVPGDLVALEQEKRVEIQKLYKLIEGGTGEYADEMTRSAGYSRAIMNELEEAQQAYAEIIERIKLTNPNHAELLAVRPAGLSEFRSRIDDNTAVLSYWIGESDITIWFITHSSVSVKTVEIARDRLLKLTEDTRKSIQAMAGEETSANLKELYSILVGPFENSLDNFSSLLVIPNGSLHFLPFQAFIDRQGKYLAESFNIVYAPSAGVFVVCNDKMVRSGSKLLGVALADVSVDNNVGLPGTGDELNRIVKLFPDNLSVTGKQGSETFIKENAASCNILHLATHGIHNYRRPLYSCLLFPPSEKDDGRLNVYEVFEMNINARLVTLSACETGLGNLSMGDEMTGLSRAFLYAGSSSVIVSLWPVADYPTALLMSNFYGYMKEYTLAEALTRAQRDVIKAFPQPVYWSPFILIGNGNLTAF